MRRLHVLIHQVRPSHQILLHQAFNALGVFNVRLHDQLSATKASLAQAGPLDVLVLDHGMPRRSGQALIDHLERGQEPHALLFVGQADDKGPDLAREARRRGLKVIAEVPWPLSTPVLDDALKRLKGSLAVRHGRLAEL
ncbi:histidine kinase [Pseudomonas entomophila]|uniref:histidine kinase n=1 Tax=Pseudomonas entomophila TaxID=312306 RepID=UPI001F00A60E|nr:histidine kinase [Pseudomonas entomophila]MCG8293982.1 histidine kinase [Pseudomonas entomophila]